MNWIDSMRARLGFPPLGVEPGCLKPNHIEFDRPLTAADLEPVSVSDAQAISDIAHAHAINAIVVEMQPLMKRLAAAVRDARKSGLSVEVDVGEIEHLSFAYDCPGHKIKPWIERRKAIDP